MTSRPMVILIGIDGGTLDLVRPWVAQGCLPALAWLLAHGAHGPLRSTYPPLTPVAWSSLLTGCSPARHGVHGFLRIPRDSYAPQFLCGGSLTIPTMLELCSAAGLRVGTINVPWTWPPHPIEGFWLSGLDAPAFGPDIAHPAGLFEELSKRFGGYFDKLVPPRRKGYALDRLNATVTKLGAMVCYLVQTRPVDLLCVVFTSTDQVQHWFWRERSVIARDGQRIDDLLLHVYRLVDAQIAAIVEECAGPDTTVIIASDHGAGPCRGGLNLNRWLAERGWLRFAKHRAGRTLPTLALRLAQAMPASLRKRLRAPLGHRRRRMLSQVLAQGIDWPHTQAFCWSDYGAISVHREHRYALGQVPDARVARLVAEIADALMALRDPTTNESAMSAVLTAADLHAETSEDAPDLLAVPYNYEWEILSEFTPAGPLPPSLEGAVFGPSLRQATHRLEGMICLHGPAVREGFTLSRARIEDVAPTIMHLLGLPVPAHMDGRVLSEALERDALRRHPPRREHVDFERRNRAAEYSDEERARIERDLGALGYL